MASTESQRVVADLWELPASSDLTVDEWRHAAGWRARLDPPPWLRAVDVDAGGVPCQWVDHVDHPGDDGPVLVYLHGGGFVVCSVGTHRELGARLATASGGRTLMVEYRLAPEHPFPVPVQDCTRAYLWVLDQGVDPRRVVLIGDSAGGNLAVATALNARQLGEPQPGAIVAVSPAPDLTFAGASNVANRPVDPFSRIDDQARIVELYLQGQDPTQPLASPSRTDLAGLAPMLVLVGPQETLLDDAVALADAAERAGVDVTLEVVEGAFHTWLGYAGEVPEADRSIERIGAFVRERTGQQGRRGALRL